MLVDRVSDIEFEEYGRRPREKTRFRLAFEQVASLYEKAGSEWEGVFSAVVRSRMEGERLDLGTLWEELPLWLTDGSTPNRSK